MSIPKAGIQKDSRKTKALQKQGRSGHFFRKSHAFWQDRDDLHATTTTGHALKTCV
jgi:hypothetical protein